MSRSIDFTKVTVAGDGNPLIRDNLAVVRDKNTSPTRFRRASTFIGAQTLMAALKQIPTEQRGVETPVDGAVANCDIIIPKQTITVPVIRAGVSALTPEMQRLMKTDTHFVGLYRNPENPKLPPVPYYDDIPLNDGSKQAYIIDPMIATGNSLIYVIEHLMSLWYEDVHIVAMLSSPEGIQKIQKMFPNVKITTAAIDEYLNSHQYIVPGLGDAGDRFFGTGAGGLQTFERYLKKISTKKQSDEIMENLAPLHQGK